MKKLLSVLLSLIFCVCFGVTLVACNDGNTNNDTPPSDEITTPETPGTSGGTTTPDNPSGGTTTPSNPSGGTTTPETPDTSTNTNILIVYFTAESGNTERLANYIQSKIGGDLVRIEAAQPYTAQELNYSIQNNRPEVEKAQNARPEIAQTTYDAIDIEKYDTLFIGYPIWWWTAPMIIGTFLEHYDLTGYDVYPFSQSASMNTTHFNTSMEFVRESAAKNGTPTVHDGLFARATNTATIDTYLDAIDFSPKVDVVQPTPTQRQTINLWGTDNIPAWSGPRNSSEAADFQPNIMFYPAQGTIKGAVLICPGGAFSFRSMSNEGYPVAEKLSALGYQSFIVNYRLSPYSQQQSALDLQRAVRYVRFYASAYGIDEKDIAIVGFSAGGILCGEHALNWTGSVSPTRLDSDYVSDAIDNINADVAAVGHIYSFYGRLSVSNNNVETLRAGNLPPTFYAYGTRDPFYSQFNQNVAATKEAGVEVESHVYENYPHGFGASNSAPDWITPFNTFLTNIFTNN